MSYDSWKTTDAAGERAGDLADAHHLAFENSQEYMDAYVDYCDDFVGSSTYERAFEKFIGDDASDDEREYPDWSDDDERDWDGIGEMVDEYDEDMQATLDDAVRYYQMHPEQLDGSEGLDQFLTDPYGDNSP